MNEPRHIEFEYKVSTIEGYDTESRDIKAKQYRYYLYYLLYLKHPIRRD